MQSIPIKLLITGANGFVGQAVCAEAKVRGLSIVAVTRQFANLPNDAQILQLENIDANTDWQNALLSVDTVIHLAARVHIMNEHSANPLQRFLDVNLYGTMNLAKQAAAFGVKRFVFVSSIKVNGEFTETKSFNELSQANPQDPYAVSKWQAEGALLQLSKETGMEVVIIRPPLVYGPRVKANFLSLLIAVNKHLPFPFGAIKNQRSLIYVGNLADAIISCSIHPKAANQLYLVCDGKDVSISELIYKLAQAFGKRCLVFPFPISILSFLAWVLGKSSAIDRLTQSLRMDSSKIHSELGWKPPYTMEQGLKSTVEWYLENQRDRNV